MTTPASSAERGWLWNIGILSFGFFICWALSTPGTTREQAVTRLSALLQFAGIVVVAWGMAELRREVGLPSLWEELRTEIGALIDKIRRRHGATIVMPGAAAMGFSGGRARVVIGLPPNATTEQRLERLERQVTELFETAGNLGDRLDAEKRDREAPLTAAKAEAEQRSADLWNKVRNISTGGIRLESVGLVWLTVGTLISGYPNSLSYLFWRS